MLSIPTRRLPRLLPKNQFSRAFSIPASRSFSYTSLTQFPSPEVAADEGLESVKDLLCLKDRNFVITGGGRGIGYAVTRAIAEMGGNVAVLDMLDKPVDGFNSLAGEFDVGTYYIRYSYHLTT